MSIPLANIPARLLSRAAAWTLAGILAGCGGGDGGHHHPPPPPKDQPALTYDIVPLSLGGRGTSGFVKATGITADGKVAGTVDLADGSLHAFRYDGNSTLDLGTMGGTEAHGEGINQRGQVVGWVRLGDTRRAFLYDGTMHDLGTLGGTDAYAFAINALGQVTGRAATAAGVFHAFLYDQGMMKELKTPGSPSLGWAINASGQVAGNFETPNFWDNGFLTDTCACTKGFGTLGGPDSSVIAMNDSGQVVGQSGAGGIQRHAFLYQNGELKDLGTLGGDNSFASDINAAGYVTGYADTKDGERHAFLYDGNSLKDLGTLGGAGSEAVALNTVNQVVGASTTAAGEWHAMSWTAAGGMVDLNKLIPRAPAGTVLRIAYAVSDNGSIVAQGNIGLVLLKVHHGH